MLLLHISSASALDISITDNPDSVVGGSIVTSDYLYFTLNKSGAIGNSSAFPGIQHNPQGLRVFDSTADYIKPGTPWEGFVVEANGSQYHNNNSLDFTLPQIGGLGYTNSSSSSLLNMTWTGRVDSLFEVTHNYSLSSTGQNLNITTTITALSDLTSTNFLRFIDPDQDQPEGTFETVNTRGLLGSLSYPENNIVCGAGPVRTSLRVCLYSESLVTHNTGVSSAWTPNPSHYLAGTNDGDGDNVIGLGFNTGNLSTGQSKTFKYSYLFSDTLDSLEELISFASLIYGPSSFDTQSSMQYQASQLRSAFNTQTVAANFGLNYDCNVFDAKGMCISAGGRYTTIDNPNINNSAAVVTLGYKVNPNIRIGAYLDQNINISNPTGIDISNNTPLMGLYAVWNKEQSGLGYQVRLANTYQDKDVTQTRTVFDTSEAGSGKTSLQSQSYLAELSYAFQYQDKTLVRPYAGIRYTHLKQKGYTEDTTDTVTDPLTLAALRDKSVTALLGVKINRSLTDKATLTAQLGFEQDVHHKVDQYSATDLNGSELTAIAFNSNIKRTRPVASIGAFYDVTKTQRASATINYQQTPFQSTGSTTAYFNYMIGF